MSNILFLQIAIKLIQQGTKAVGHMCSSVLFPVVPFVLHVVVVAWFAFVGIYLSSAGDRSYIVSYDHEDFGTLSSRYVKYPTR